MARLTESVQGRDSKDRLLYVPSHPARELDKDLAAAGVSKRSPEGKLDFHALRVAYTNFVSESGATLKEAQTLARHTDPRIAANVYGRTRLDRLQKLAEDVGQAVSPDKECCTGVARKAVGAEGMPQPPFDLGVAGKRSGGGGGNRTRVPRPVGPGIYARSLSFDLAARTPTGRLPPGQPPDVSRRTRPEAPLVRPARFCRPSSPAGEVQEGRGRLGSHSQLRIGS